jgi:hypothetical protein
MLSLRAASRAAQCLLGEMTTLTAADQHTIAAVQKNRILHMRFPCMTISWL